MPSPQSHRDAEADYGRMKTERSPRNSLCVSVSLWLIVMGEIFDHPASGFGDLSQPHVGVGRHGMSYHCEQVAIRKAVGVSEGMFQVEAGGAIDSRQAFGFRLAVGMRARESPGKTPLFDLKLRSDPRVNSQALGQRLQQQVERARKQDDEMSGVLMPAKPVDGFR